MLADNFFGLQRGSVVVNGDDAGEEYVPQYALTIIPAGVQINNAVVERATVISPNSDLLDLILSALEYNFANAKMHYNLYLGELKGGITKEVRT